MTVSLKYLFGGMLLVVLTVAWFITTYNIFYPLLVWLGAVIVVSVYYFAHQKGEKKGYRKALLLQNEPVPLNRLTEQTYFVLGEWYESPWQRKVYALTIGDPNKMRNYSYFYGLAVENDENPYEVRKDGMLTLLVRKSDNVLRKLSLHDGSSCARCGERVELVGVQVACTNCGFVYAD